MTKMVSVIIPSYNSEKTIRHTLDGILTLQGNHLKEVIVVDSSDNTAMDEIKKHYSAHGVQFINAGIRVMPAIGRNIGARHATGKILAFIDSDAYPSPEWLQIIVSEYNKGRLAGGGSVELPDFQRNNGLAIAQLYLQLNEFMNVGKDRVKQFIPSVNLYCDRELFMQAGGFPQIRASEDTLFGFAINRITPLWFLPEAKVFHIFREDRSAFLRNQKLLGRYIIIYRRMHFQSLLYRSIIPVVLFPGFLLVKFTRMAFRICASRPGETARFIKVLPVFLLGLAYWSIGFIQGCFAGEN